MTLDGYHPALSLEDILYAELKKKIEQSPDEVRGQDLRLPTDCPLPTPLYAHQAKSVEALMNFEISGVIHLPTGAGKTRVALSWMAEKLLVDPGHRFIWASYPKVLMQQALASLVDLAPLFPKKMPFTWVENAERFRSADLFSQVTVVFCMRDHLTQFFEAAADRRRRDALTSHLGRNLQHRISIIYDECHQLGAENLQKALRKFHRNDDADGGRLGSQLRFIGLSATPLPSGDQQRHLLRERLFPVLRGTPTVKADWGMMVHTQVSNEELIKKKVLCPVNIYFQETRKFDVPPELLRKVIGQSRVSNPPRDGNRVELEKFAKQFNGSVMSSNEIVDFLAAEIGDHLQQLGKTLVFAATIRAAERMVFQLQLHPKVGRGRVSLVHSRLDDEGEDLNADRDNPRTIAAFRERRHEACILVNVGMLTTGFDDPAIRTVVLARLTFSTNLFWQMIGRGTRGPATGGTADCYVIDPVRLTAIYGYAEYQPKLVDTGYSDRDWDEESARGADRASALLPQLPTMNVPPPPSVLPPIVDAELLRMRPEIARTVRAFLGKEIASSDDTAEMLLAARITVDAAGQVHIGVATSGPEPATQAYFLAERILRIEARLGESFAWVQEIAPSVQSPEAVAFFTRSLDWIERNEIRSYAAWLQYLSGLLK